MVQMRAALTFQNVILEQTEFDREQLGPDVIGSATSVYARVCFGSVIDLENAIIVVAQKIVVSC